MGRTQLECVKKAIKKYKEKCVNKSITFYPTNKDQELLEFCKTINFQGEIKKFLWRKYKKSMRDLDKQQKGE